MTERPPSPAELERRLAALGAEYERVKARLAEVGFICEGSLVERFVPCGKPTCRCTDPARRHGPYWQLSWKRGGRTVSRRLSATQARLYREWIGNRRQLGSLVDEMKAISLEAGQYMLEGIGEPIAAADELRTRPRSGG
jgi:hypothetical protein